MSKASSSTRNEKFLNNIHSNSHYVSNKMHARKYVHIFSRASSFRFPSFIFYDKGREGR